MNEARGVPITPQASSFRVYCGSYNPRITPSSLQPEPSLPQGGAERNSPPAPHFVPKPRIT